MARWMTAPVWTGILRHICAVPWARWRCSELSVSPAWSRPVAKRTLWLLWKWHQLSSPNPLLFRWRPRSSALRDSTKCIHLIQAWFYWYEFHQSETLWWSVTFIARGHVHQLPVSSHCICALMIIQRQSVRRNGSGVEVLLCVEICKKIRLCFPNCHSLKQRERGREMSEIIVTGYRYCMGHFWLS